MADGNSSDPKRPAGAVVGRESIRRACGHSQEFLLYELDPYREQRRAKFVRKRCPPCGLLANQQHNLEQKANAPIKKGQEVKLLPIDTIITLLRRADGIWYGSLSVGTGEIIGSEASGLMSLISKLARKWLQSQGARLKNRVVD